MEDSFVLFLVVGFLAQIVDGALGMAYGVVSSSVLLAFGVPPRRCVGQRPCGGTFHHRSLSWIPCVEQEC
jgi:uncharacterized membrane protein YfcA